MEQENEEDLYFRFSATLRIFGSIANPDELTERLGLLPTHLHRKGEQRTPHSAPYEHDMWSYKADVSPERPLGEHLLVLRRSIGSHVDYLKRLKEHLTVDVFCGYRSNSGTAGFKVEYEAFEIFRDLEVPFDVSVIIA
jgi:hypothetical protein